MNLPSTYKISYFTDIKEEHANKKVGYIRWVMGELEGDLQLSAIHGIVLTFIFPLKFDERIIWVGLMVWT